MRSPLAPEALARTLRAVAAELERDPALARRVAAAVTADTISANAAIPIAAPSAGLPPEHTPPPDDSPVGAPAGRLPAPAGGDLPEPPTTARLNRSFRPRLITGASPDLGAGIPDPFALHKKLGAIGLRAALDDLRLGTLRAIVREHGLDPKGTLSRQNDADKLRAAILAAAAKAHQ